ncbi:non-ribosomal peptide synthetase, partial [Clostridium perfringens]|uniref:condensation domain-containing protein n=1 Tax=Clostridium perfringens TaxID=1502 RepID=UPI0014181E7D
NKNDLPDPGDHIVSDTVYEEPRNEIERTLVEIWEEILGVKGIGINHSYYELGGDSIKAIQIVAKLNKNNLEVSTKDILKYFNIKSLSKKVKMKKREAYQGEVIGDVKLTAIQKWFFSINSENDYNHFNQGILLKNKNRFDEEILRETFNEILKHHDALRMSFKLNKDEILQTNNRINENMIKLPVINITDNIEKTIKCESEKVQKDIRIDEGDMVKVRLFRTLEEDYLLIVVHHLVIDGVSWRIIFEDFNTLYNQISRGDNVKLSKKTDAFKVWSKGIYEYSKSIDDSKLSYWKNININDVKIIPKDYIIEKRYQKNSKTLELEINENKTKEILEKVNNIYNTNTEDILLAALKSVLIKWTGYDKILINLEGHGREDILENIDISRTVGWFTSMYPMLLETKKNEDLDYRIKNIKETLRSIPNKGIDYGINKYINNQDLNLKPEISFNYLGEFDNDLPDGLSISNLDIGNFYGNNICKEFAIDINARLINNKILISFTYDKYEYKDNTIYKLLSNYKKNIDEIIDYCSKKTNKEITPSDLGSDNLTLDELEEIFDYIEN